MARPQCDTPLVTDHHTAKPIFPELAAVFGTMIKVANCFVFWCYAVTWQVQHFNSERPFYSENPMSNDRIF
jgi:hypothetical protein